MSAKFPQNLTLVAIVLVIGVAFIDGILIAQSWQRDSSAEATEIILLEDAFEELKEEPEGKQTIEELTQEPTEDPLKTSQTPKAKRTPNFYSQSPMWDWKAPWTDFADEAVLLMAMDHKNQKEELSSRQAANALVALSEWLRTNVTKQASLTLEEMQRAATENYGVNSHYIVLNPSVEVLISKIEQGALVILPVDATRLNNPHHSKPAPKDHVLLIHSYNPAAGTFITHDPGTNKGANTEYGQNILHLAIQEGNKKALVIN